MGLFKAFKKLGKSIFKGIHKVFLPAAQLIKKVVGKKWAKRLMIAAAVFTGGMALLSGVGGFLGGTGFFGRFVSGGQAFVKGLFNPVGAAKGAMTGLKSGGIGGVFSGAAQGAGFAPAAATGAAGAGGGTAGAAPAVTPTAGATGGYNAQNMANMAPPGMAPPAGGAGTAAQNLANPAAAGGGGGMLSKVGNFAMSPGGGMLISNAVQGYAQGKMAEAHQDRLDENSESKQDPESVAMYQDSINQDLGALPRFRQEMDRRMERIRSRGRGNYENEYAVA